MSLLRNYIKLLKNPYDKMTRKYKQHFDSLKGDKMDMFHLAKYCFQFESKSVKYFFLTS